MTPRCLVLQLSREQHVDAAVQRAKGISVKNDKRLLKNSIKRDEHKKKKSAKAWCVRCVGSYVAYS